MRNPFAADDCLQPRHQYWLVSEPNEGRHCIIGNLSVKQKPSSQLGQKWALPSRAEANLNSTGAVLGSNSHEEPRTALFKTFTIPLTPNSTISQKYPCGRNSSVLTSLVTFLLLTKASEMFGCTSGHTIQLRKILVSLSGNKRITAHL